MEHFTSRFLSAKRSIDQKQPWVMVTSISKAQTLLWVYSTLKAQGVLDEWPRQFCDLRKDAGICVLALMP